MGARRGISSGALGAPVRSAGDYALGGGSSGALARDSARAPATGAAGAVMRDDAAAVGSGITKAIVEHPAIAAQAPACELGQPGLPVSPHPVRDGSDSP